MKKNIVWNHMAQRHYILYVASQSRPPLSLFK